MERYTMSQAAQAIGVTPRILSEWLADAQIVTSAGDDKRARYLTRQQVLRLADAHHRTIKDDPRATKLAAILQALETGLHDAQIKIATLESRLSALESQPPTRPSTPADLPRIEPQSATWAFAGALSKTEAARLVAERHGVAFNTVRGWPWPAEALESEAAAIRWALGYVARNPRQHPAGWRARCEVAGCPCREP